MDTIKPLFTATATATGGRNGYTESSDGVVKANLSVPKEMGGPGKPGTATPEHLFAAGYAACFGGALDFVGEFNRSTQHLLILPDEEVCVWSGTHGRGSRRSRRPSFGTAGGTVNV